MQLDKVNVVAKPPAIYFISTIAGILLQLIWPLPIVFWAWLSAVGLLLVALGVAVSIWGD